MLLVVVNSAHSIKLDCPLIPSLSIYFPIWVGLNSKIDTYKANTYY